MNRFGRVFVNSRYTVSPGVIEDKVCSVLLGSTSTKTELGNHTFFVANTGAGDAYVTGIGCDFDLDNHLAVIASAQYPSSKGRFYLLNGGNYLTPKLQNMNIYELQNGNFTYYGGKWYISHAFSLAQTGGLWRVNSDLSVVENGITTNAIWNTHAKSADYIYTSSAGRIITNNGGTISASYANSQDTFNSVACDPTGQYLMANIAGTGIAKSSDYGATWTALSNFPAGAKSSNSIHFVNLGDAYNWAVTYNDYPYPTFKIVTTSDFGFSWTS